MNNYLDKTIVIGALARDCADRILRIKNRIEELRSFFSSSYVVIIENDSKDNTKEVLKEYSNEFDNITIISKDYDGIYPFSYSRNATNVGMSCDRIARMVFFRNKLLKYAQLSYKTDYTIFLDIDVYDFDVDGIIKSIIEAPTDWGALFANGYYTYRSLVGIRPLPNQYDSYAYLDMTENCNLGVCLMDKKVQYNRSIMMSNRIKQNRYTKCLSAFGGLAVYKSSVIQDFSYSIFIPQDWKTHGTCLCEHIPFNLKIGQKGYSCYISRDMRVNYGIFDLAGLKGLILRISPKLLNWLSLLK